MPSAVDDDVRPPDCVSAPRRTPDDRTRVFTQLTLAPQLLLSRGDAKASEGDCRAEENVQSACSTIALLAACETAPPGSMSVVAISRRPSSVALAIFVACRCIIAVASSIRVCAFGTPRLFRGRQLST